ncbi:MAG: C40 family peptidase [Nevskia sp.]|nr:C40 family peptidase [Nevskia sp.]
MQALRRYALSSLLVLAALLQGCVNMGSGQEKVARETIIETALGQVGRPYRYGGGTPDGFDCSGLVAYSYAEAGIQVPHNTSALRKAGSRIDLGDARPGDLLFYRFENSPNALHVAIYLGHGKMVHAPAAGKQVSVIHTDDTPWPGRFLGAERLVP